MAQDVSAAWTVEERDSVRSIAENLLVSWKKESTLSSRTFTIGVSAIGGSDIIGLTPGSVGSPGQYKYFDESSYVMSLAWEYGLNFPTGGLSVGMAEAELDNTSGRFLPDYMGGSSELFTAILPRRPMIINAGFNFEGIDQTIPQFSGILSRSPQVDIASRQVQLQAKDYVDFFYKRYLDEESMFTGQRTDQVYETLLQSMGLSTSQYVLDIGLNTIDFGLFERNTQYSKIFHDLAEAENGQFYQDEQGIFRFENRNHGNNAPHNQVQRIVLTGQVIDAQAPDEDKIVNVVEVIGQYREKTPNQIVFSLSLPIELPAGQNVEIFTDFIEPILELSTPQYWEANTSEDGTGTDIKASVSLHNYDVFANAAKLTFTNNSGSNGYLTGLTLYGRQAVKVADINFRQQDDSSLTAYEEHVLRIENPYIQNPTWAQSYALMILQDYSEPNSLQKITIRAIPELQIGDLVSWQGIPWRVYNIKAKLSPSSGFTQDLTMLKHVDRDYFTIGISSIGGPDGVAP